MHSSPNGGKVLGTARTSEEGMFNRIDHVAILVSDIDEGRALFEDVYGLECWGTNSAEHRESSGADAAFFDVGEAVLELMSPIDAPDNDGWAATHMEEHGEGFFHIAYAVDDIYEAMETLQEHGIGVLSEEPGEGFSGAIVTCDPADTIMPTQIVEPNGTS